MSKLQDKIDQLKSEGWNLKTIGTTTINRRSYKFAKLEKDGETVFINHNGGTGGLSSVIARQTTKK